MSEEEVVVETEEKPPEVDPKIVERARVQGWVPIDEFKGDKERWISAKEFVDRADTVMPILRSQNKKLETKILDIEKELREQRELAKKMIKIHGKYTEDMYNDRITVLKRMKAEAVEEGNVEKYNRLEQEETSIKPPEKLEIDEAPQQKLDPEVARWQQENSHWFGVDEELTEYTNIVADRLAKKGHALSPYQFCEEVKKKVKTMFPEKFNGSKASGVDEGSTRGSETSSSKKGKSWNDLPKDAREQCASLMATIPGYTKEKYLKDYFEGE